MSFNSSSILPVVIIAAVGLWYAYSYLSAYIAKQPEGTMKLWARNVAPWSMCAVGSGIMAVAFASLTWSASTPQQLAGHDDLFAQIAWMDRTLQSHVDGSIDLDGKETNHADLYSDIIKTRKQHIEAVNNIPSPADYRTKKETSIALIFLFMIGVITTFYGIYMALEVRRTTYR